MTLAEKLKNVNQFTESEKEFLKEQVLNGIKTYGRFSVICAGHIDVIRWYAIPLRYEKAYIELMLSEGLHIRHSQNSFGVPTLVVTL